MNDEQKRDCAPTTLDINILRCIFMLFAILHLLFLSFKYIFGLLWIQPQTVALSTDFTGDFEVPEADLATAAIDEEEFFPINLNAVLVAARNTVAEAQSAEDFYDMVKENINTAKEYVATAVEQAQTTTEEVIEATKCHLCSASESIRSIASTAKEKSTRAYSAVKDAFQTTKEELNRAVVSAGRAGSDVIDTAKDKIQQNAPSAEVAKERFNQVAADMMDNVGAAATYTKDRATNAASTVKDKISDAKK